MAASEDLTAVLDRVARNAPTSSDTERLRRLVQVRGDGNSVQLGRHNISLQAGGDIHVGDRVYRGVEAYMIREALTELVYPSPGLLHSFGGRVITIGMIVALVGMAMFFVGLISPMQGPPTFDGPPAEVIRGFGIAFVGVMIGAVGGLIRGWERPHRH